MDAPSHAKSSTTLLHYYRAVMKQSHAFLPLRHIMAGTSAQSPSSNGRYRWILHKVFGYRRHRRPADAHIELHIPAAAAPADGTGSTPQEDRDEHPTDETSDFRVQPQQPSSLEKGKKVENTGESSATPTQGMQQKVLISNLVLA